MRRGRPSDRQAGFRGNGVPRDRFLLPGAGDRDPLGDPQGAGGGELLRPYPDSASRSGEFSLLWRRSGRPLLEGAGLGRSGRAAQGRPDGEGGPDLLPRQDGVMAPFLQGPGAPGERSTRAHGLFPRRPGHGAGVAHGGGDGVLPRPGPLSDRDDRKVVTGPPLSVETVVF